ncbi:hypothetical protein HRI_003145500 [Hibiscus trionum]|uniref:Reverse transcriptase domain-containing protein n=1 Tax=Hibiscus trionum TaxID=183268 RepID=A0A9W7IGK2_HIBTR|nr:hypothetical protein HRI_003145500 [Hibiscus trionum]
MKKSEVPGIIFKADFRKAYDLVDWGFLMLVLKKLGFGEKWRQWIMYCISSANISILVNGSPTPFFSIRRGLRQGCPLSPLLFNLVVETLSALIKSTMSKGFFEAVQIGNSNVKVSHLQFTDDLIIFCGASEMQVKNVVRLLKGFEYALGLRLNLQKSNLIGINLSTDTLEGWAVKVNCSTVNLPCTYLGLPLGCSKNSVALSAPVVEKFKKRMAGWKAKLMSFSGRIVLVKSVLSNLPVYYMSLFEMPATIFDQLNKMIAKFLWGSPERRTIHWLNWKVLCKPKCKGGLGLMDMKLKNRVLLNKWIWRFGAETESFWRKVLQAKYEKNSTCLMPLNLSRSNKSWIWRGIISPLNSADDPFSCNLFFTVGDRKSIRFWEDMWVGRVPLKMSFSRIFALASKKEGKIEDFGKLEGFVWRWHIVLRRNLFDWEIPIWDEFMFVINSSKPGRFPQDSLRWRPSSNGVYSPKEFCRLVDSTIPDPEQVWPMVWANLTPPKVESFTWRLVHEKIPTKSELRKRGMISNSSLFCDFCGIAEEAPSHLFCECVTTWSLWQKWCKLWDINLVMPSNPRDLLLWWFECQPSIREVQVWRLSFFSMVWTI